MLWAALGPAPDTDAEGCTGRRAAKAAAESAKAAAKSAKAAACAVFGEAVLAMHGSVAFADGAAAEAWAGAWPRRR